MEIDTDDQFEDFTTASDWEQFTARLEQLITEWHGQPVESENVNNNWMVVHEKVTFSDFAFNFSYYKRVKDGSSAGNNLDSTLDSSNSVPLFPPHILRILASESEFPPKMLPCPVPEFFSIEEFAVLAPISAEPIHSESQLKILLSSACVALNNTTCNFPIFVQFHMRNHHYYYGIAESVGVRTTFQMIRLKSIPFPSYLSGILDVFKSKIGQNLSAPIVITAHFFYNMNAWHEDFTYDPFPPELFDLLKTSNSKSDSALQLNSGDIDKENRVPISDWVQCCSHSAILPFGSMDDPFSSMELVVGWPTLTDDVVVDSATYTDLEPENAPEWHFSLKSDANADFRLRDVLEGIWSLQTEHMSVKDILGKSIEDSSDDCAQYTSALDRLTDPVAKLPAINTVIDTAQKRLLYNPSLYTDLPPITSDNLDTALRFLFPDAQPDPLHEYLPSFEKQPDFVKESGMNFWENLQNVKSAPIGSLVWRLAMLMGNLHIYNGSNMAVAHMWTEFILELRYRLEKTTLICGLERGAPNSNSCLLNQKLQMLNCCIEKKIARAQKENEKMVSEDNELEEESEEDNDEEDEFFDCDDTMNSNSNENAITKLHKPAGRLRKCGRLRLLNTGEPMYIPITQDPAPLTEDVVEEQAKILVELGNDAEGSEMRAKMMSASLLSDMEAFKAANPGATLEDFVRWYSPRDWLETEETDKFGNNLGDLSARMKVPGNLWIDVWSTAQAVPVRRQKRLFDDTREAEKVLHWLGNQTLSDICHLLFPCLVHAAALKVVEEADSLPFDYQLPTNLPQQVSQFTRCFGHICGSASETAAAKNQVISTIARCELEITQIRSLQHKFPNLDLTTILKSRNQQGTSNDETYGPEFLPKYIKVDGGFRSDIGRTVKEIFVKEQAVNHLVEIESEFKFGKPVKRVFVLKYIPPKSIASESVGYLCLPQRMSCLLRDDLFLSAGTFSLRTDVG